MLMGFFALIIGICFAGTEYAYISVLAILAFIIDTVITVARKY